MGESHLSWALNGLPSIHKPRRTNSPYYFDLGRRRDSVVRSSPESEPCRSKNPTVKAKVSRLQKTILEISASEFVRFSQATYFR